MADDQAWARIKRACEQRARIIAPPSNGPVPLEAYHPIVFGLTTGDSFLDQTHLFLHGLKYKWTFHRKDAESVIESDEPQVVEYAQGAGELSVKVEILRDADSAVIEGPKLEIQGSQDFAWKEGLERVEIFSLLLATMVAIATGISTVYLKNTSFGTFQDYLLLFLWGAAVDQTKNALQILQSYSSSPVK